MNRDVGLFDYGSGNLHSAARALTKAGGRVVVSGDPGQLLRRSALVLPGVGSFAACMAGLRAAGGVELIRAWCATGKPLLGICVGHQVLFSDGEEGGRTTPGLGIYEGSITRLGARRLPHMGWNTVRVPAGSRLFAGLAGEQFYFVHSYAAPTGVPGALTSTAEHEGLSFVAAVERDNVSSTQFHPEKSGAAGARLLSNWLGTR